MKKIILSGICLLLTNVIVSQTAVLNVFDKTVMKEEPVAAYFLPRTVLQVEVEATQIIRTVGPYASDARKQLGKAANIQKNEEVWSITGIHVKQMAEPDPDNRFRVYASAKSFAGFLSLNETGVLRGINLPFISTEVQRNVDKPNKKQKEKKSKAEPFVTNYLPKDVAEKDAVASIVEQINNLRQVRDEILLQHNDVLHGEAVKLYLREIDKREAELTALFNGKEEKKTIKRTFTVYPDREVTNQEIFRFSEKQGFSDSGNPFVINLKKRLTGEKGSSNTTNEKGFAYRIPALTDVEITGNKTTFWTGIINVAQMGRLSYLPVGFFDKEDVRAVFDTQTGALLQIGK